MNDPRLFFGLITLGVAALLMISVTVTERRRRRQVEAEQHERLICCDWDTSYADVLIPEKKTRLP
jgi:hypothetical protein